jgi:hypothetical protein
VRPLRAPEFNEDRFPPELLGEHMSAQEKWMLRAIWKLDRKVDWLVDSLVEENATLKDIDIREQETAVKTEERLKTLEDWKLNLMGKWGVVSVAVVTCVTAVLSASINLVIKAIFK